MDTILAPKVVARQLLLVLLLETGLFTWKQLTHTIEWLTSHISSRKRLLRKLQQQQLQATTTQDEWMELAERMDQIQGNDVWRSIPDCPLYERERISARIDEFVHLMRRHDIFELMFLLRGSIGRNKFGLLHEGLFTKARAGTKVLVETYHNVICAALDFVCDAQVLPDQDPIPTEARLAFFNETRHSYGRTALLLSGGAALGFYHIGVVRTLMENRLMPRVIGGSSAGSIVCAMIGTRTDEECTNDLFQVKGTHAPGHSGKLAMNFFRPYTKRLNPKSVKQQQQQQQQQEQLPEEEEDSLTTRTTNKGGWLDFYYNTAGAFHDMKLTLIGFMPLTLRRFTAFMYDVLSGSRRPSDVFKNDTDYFRECVRVNVGNFTFQEAFDRTGRILNIVVTPMNSSDPPRLLNYLTAPHVMVWSAAVASSSLPGVFEANRLVVKEADGWERYESGGQQAFSDGSMEQDLPTQQLSEMFNVNHFIISQANPHAVMFASYNHKAGVWTNPLIGALESILRFLRDQVRSWLLHLVDCVGARRIAPLFETSRGIGASFFTQEYEGRSIDISLIPWLGHRSLLSAILHIIYNPCEAEFREWIQASARETWKHIPAIKSHISEEVTLDRCVQRLRKRMLKESWEKRQGEHAQRSTLNQRVPSFFNSPSLLNMGGLNVSDQQTIETLRPSRSNPKNHNNSNNSIGEESPDTKPIVNHIEIGPGWGGMGLRGNRSSGNLRRTSSDASGLFYEDSEEHAREQNAGEDTSNEATLNIGNRKITDPIRSGSEGNLGKPVGEYIKTSTMASFYYRQNPSFDGLARTTSNPHMAEDVHPKGGGHHQRKRSKSHADLFTK